MKKVVAGVLLILLALGGYVASGPWRTVHAIRAALQAQDASALARQVDFPSVRASLKAQMEDRLARATGPSWQSPLLAQAGLALAHGVLEASVDAMVTPSGLSALMEGRAVWKRLHTGFASSEAPQPAPLHDAHYRFESASAFTATVFDADHAPTVFVLRRHGLDWKLAEIRLPPP